MSQRDLFRRRQHGGGGAGGGGRWVRLSRCALSLEAELEQTLTAAADCYVGLVGAALTYGLILAAPWRNHCHWAQPRKLLTRQGQGAALGSRAQVGRRCPGRRLPGLQSSTRGQVPVGRTSSERLPVYWTLPPYSSQLPSSLLPFVTLYRCPFFFHKYRKFEKIPVLLVVLSKGGGIVGPRPTAPWGGLSRVS